MKRSLNGGTKVHPLSEHAKAVLAKLKNGPIPAYTINPGVRDVLKRKGYATIQPVYITGLPMSCLIWLSDPPNASDQPEGKKPATDASAIIICAHKPKAHPNPYWMVYYEDADVRPRIFINEHAARAFYAQTSINWNCHLFCGVESNISGLPIKCLFGFSDPPNASYQPEGNKPAPDASAAIHYYPKPKAHPNPYWMVYYEDADARQRIFTDEHAARAFFAQTSINWNCLLFKGVESNHA